MNERRIRGALAAIITGGLALEACAPRNEAGASVTSSPTNNFTPVETATHAPYESPAQVKETAEILPFIYYSQKNYPNEKVKGGCTWRQEGCGIMVGAMVTRTDPFTYYQEFLKYFESQGQDGIERFTCKGTVFEDHKKVLESMGYTFIRLSTDGATLDQIKSRIKKYTDKGIGVWVDTSIWNGDVWVPHHTMAVRVKQNTIVFNDPYFGENLAITDSRIDRDVEDGDPKTVWKVYAVVPPKTGY